MSRNLALEKLGRAKLAYELQQRGWRVGEAFEDGYDLLAHYPEQDVTCLIELKSMDVRNRTSDGNLTAPVSPTERETCTHIVVYAEPHGWFFIARKKKVLTAKGNVYAALNDERSLRKPREGSKSLTHFLGRWDELLKLV